MELLQTVSVMQVLTEKSKSDLQERYHRNKLQIQKEHEQLQFQPSSAWLNSGAATAIKRGRPRRPLLIGHPDRQDLTRYAPFARAAGTSCRRA